MRWEHWFFTIPLRLRSILRRAQVERELDEELQFHIEQRMQRELAAGRTPEEARGIALRSMEGLEQRKEECRDSRRVNRLENVAQDVRFAWRGLLKKPGFSVVAILTLALGIGANSAIFSVIDAALLKPLPYPKPEQLVLLFELFDKPNVVSFANFADWERESHSFSSMAAGTQNTFTLGGMGSAAPERIEGGIYSWALFRTLRVRATIGRTFSPEDDRPGAPRVAVISYGLWQRRFAGTSDILHRQVRLDGVNCNIIGVMPEGFGYPTRSVEVWTPIQALFGDALANRGWHQLYVVGRLREGVIRKAATAEVSGIQQRIRAENAGDLLGTAVTSLPLRDVTTQESRTSLYILFGAVGCLLLIACVNVSNLSIARGAQRRREFSIRAALGARRSRLIQQVLTESLLLALLGCGAGLLLGYALTGGLGTHATTLIRADDIDTSAPIRMDGAVLGFTMLLSLFVGIAAGLLPARHSARGDLTEGLKEGGRSATGGHAQQRLRTALIGAEVALSLVLLVIAGLMIRSFAQLQGVRPGLNAENLLTAAISLPDNRYGPESVARFSKTLLDRARALQGVKGAALVNCLPVDGYCGDNTFSIEGRALPPNRFDLALNRSASPGYFHVAGIPLLVGRDFTERDGRGFDEKHPHVSALIVSESMARKFWPQGDALRKKVYFGDEHSPRYQIVGIVGDVPTDLDKPPQPTMYTPALEGRHTDFYIVLRTASNPAALALPIRRTVSGIDPEIPAFQIRSMSEILGQSTESRAFTAILLGSFAGLALVLSAVGLYGVLSYLISQRTAEIGIRMALGAHRGEVCRLALFQGLKPALIGLAIGSLVALVLARTIQSALFEVKASDPLTFLVAPLVLLLATFIASIVPVWRAANIDPIRVLRNE